MEGVRTPAIAQIVIEMDAQRKVSVTGPIGDRGLCHLMLGEAADIIRDHCAKLATEQRIIAPPPGMASALHSVR